jgi:hypothetical protein
MSVRIPHTALLLSLLILLSVPAQAFVGGIAVSLGRATNTEGAEVPAFSADATMETEEHQLTSQVYYKPGMVRDVTDAGGMEMVTIQRYDLGKVWVLMGQGMYMETDIGEAEQAPEYKLVERSVVGTETIDGLETTKYKTIYEGPDGRFGGFTWFTKDNIAVKGFMVSETKGEKHRIKWTLTNVQLGDQPDALFELPAGAKPMGSMGGLMNMMGGMGGMGGSGSSDASDPNAPGDTSLQDTATSVLQGVGKSLGNLFGN